LSFRFSHSSFPDRPWLAPHASRGERGKKSAGYDGPGKTPTGFTADGKLRTEPRTGPWTVEGRGVDWVREGGDENVREAFSIVYRLWGNGRFLRVEMKM
jgi:hypothetical protein